LGKTTSSGLGGGGGCRGTGAVEVRGNSDRDTHTTQGKEGDEDNGGEKQQGTQLTKKRKAPSQRWGKQLIRAEIKNRPPLGSPNSRKKRGVQQGRWEKKTFWTARKFKSASKGGNPNTPNRKKFRGQPQRYEEGVRKTGTSTKIRVGQEQ